MRAQGFESKPLKIPLDTTPLDMVEHAEICVDSSVTTTEEDDEASPLEGMAPSTSPPSVPPSGNVDDAKDPTGFNPAVVTLDMVRSRCDVCAEEGAV